MNSNDSRTADYSFGNEWQKARERLRALDELLDPTSIDHLLRVGVASGWTCLEVGAGSGSMTDWLCRRVGPTGRVVATDLDTRFVEALKHPNLEVHVHDIVTDPLIEGHFDLVHCRLVLEHVDDTERALRNMAQALKSGGWILIEETDDSTFLADPHADARSRDLFHRALDAVHRAMADRGYDGEFGAKVYGLLARLGLEDLGAEGRAATRQGGSSAGELGVLSYEQMREQTLATGLITIDDFDAATALWRDPNFSWRQFLCVATWGRRPQMGK